MNFEKSKALQKRAHEVIPGGSHTYAKGDDQYPELVPGFIARGQGCHVWDVDGNEFIEYNMGGRAVVLGHAFRPVVEAVRRELDNGCNFSRPADIEVACAEEFLGMIPNADMVKFCKDGSSATSGALKLARAATGRDHIAYCKDHPFFSINDWFIGTTSMNAGHPARDQRPLALLSLQRHRKSAGTVQNAPGKNRRCDPRSCEVRRSGEKFPPRGKARLSRKRGGVHPGRNDHRFPVAQRRRPEILRYRS